MGSKDWPAIHMALHRDEGGFFNQRARVHPVVKTIAHPGRGHLGGELLHKFDVDPALHVATVGAHAGLAGVAVLAGKGAFDGAVDVDVDVDVGIVSGRAPMAISAAAHSLGRTGSAISRAVSDRHGPARSRQPCLISIQTQAQARLL